VVGKQSKITLFAKSAGMVAHPRTDAKFGLGLAKELQGVTHIKKQKAFLNPVFGGFCRDSVGECLCRLVGIVRLGEFTDFNGTLQTKHWN